MAKESNWLLLLCFLILSLFVAGIHGNRQAEALGNLYKSKFFKGHYPEKERTLFEAEEVVFEADPQEGLKEKDRISKLPGQPPVRFNQYGGYVTVDKEAERAFYYYFVEAQRSKDSLPLLLWLNGGPGCSSLGYGAMQELGPFRVNSDGKTLFKTKYPWNHAANVLFLESPAGVGFSYSNRTSDYDNIGDKRTAEDNYVFLVNWLERFPEYKNRDFYISGESYAGHYVPQLAHTILYHNKMPNKTTPINLKGIIIGNAVINDETDAKGMYDYYGSHALISEETASIIRKFCDFSPNATNQTKQCDAAASEAEGDIYQIDVYNIYAPRCKDFNLTAIPKKTSNVIDPCSDYYVDAFLNRPDVQEALHANVTKLNHKWSSCSTVIGTWGDSPFTVLPLLQEFLHNGLRVWIFSGDIDGRVPFTSTQYSIDKMNLTVNTSHPWFFNDEVGGYTTVYEGGLTFATVREAGHQVPSYKPGRALSLIKHFLHGTPLPNRYM